MLENGKKVIYVDGSNFASNVADELLTPQNSISKIPDKIRYFSSNFWTIEKNQIKKANLEPVFSINYLHDDVYSLKANKAKFYEDVIENGLLTKKFNKKLWDEFLTEIIPNPNQKFEDFYTNFSEPINLSELDNNNFNTINFINREFVYNFLSKNFESLISDQLFDVNILPSIYNVLNDKQVDTKTSEENLIVSLGGILPDSSANALYTSNKVSDSLKFYFDEYAKAFNTEAAQAVIKEIKRINTDLTLNADKLSLIKKINNKFVPFPFYLQAEFSNQASEKDSFLAKLKNFGNLDVELLQFIKDQFSNTTKQFVFSSDESVPTETFIQQINLKNWLNANISESPSDDEILNPTQLIKYINLLNFIKNNIKQKTRNFSNILDQSCYHQILFYKIEKRSFNYNKNNKPITTFFIVPNDLNTIKFIDTQIKYGTEYFYTVTAYTMVVGTEYIFQNYYNSNSTEQNFDLQNGEYKIKIVQTPSYKIFEMPVANFKGAVFEPPLTRPIISLNKQEEKIIFNLLPSDLTSLEEINIIENNDFKLFELIKESQDNENPNLIKTVETFSSNKKLQIYRTTKYPKDFLDFQGKLYKTLDLKNNLKSFSEQLLTNIKYYYTFRYINEHEIPSNLSDIFEIELKDEDGYYMLESKKINLKQQYPREQFKKMKKYLLLRPSLIQTRPIFDKDVTTVEQIKLGPKKDQVWDKPFILRIKSLKSNRILEFNIKTTINKKKQ